MTMNPTQKHPAIPPAKTPEEQKPPTRICPHCLHVDPVYAVNITAGPVPGVGFLESVTYSCEKCHKILSVHMTHLLPTPEFQAMIAQMREEATKQPGKPS